MGGLPIDLILFAMVAAFLVLRLRSVLGRRTGFERPPQTEAAPVPAGRGPATEVEIAAKPSQGPLSGWRRNRLWHDCGSLCPR